MITNKTLAYCMMQFIKGVHKAICIMAITYLVAVASAYGIATIYETLELSLELKVTSDKDRGQ